MKALNVVGPGATDVAERLTARLDGRVATVERLPTVESQAMPEAAAAYGLAAGGSWVGAGDDRTVEDLLDELAVDYDYVLLIGFETVELPTVAVGGLEDVVSGDLLHVSDEPDGVDYDAVLGALSDLEPHVTLDSLVHEAKRSADADRAGAIATFTGRVRTRDAADDDPTLRLRFEKYGSVADERMDLISRELADRDGVFEVLMHHRTGVVEAGEDIVFVVVLAGHREEAFRTVEDGINRLKDEVPLFKKETTSDREFWVHERR